MDKDQGKQHTRRQTPGVGRTERAREGEREPRLPHERDESADSQGNRGPTPGSPQAGEVGKKGFEDLRSGRQDTGRAPVTDAVYEKQQEPAKRGS